LCLVQIVTLTGVDPDPTETILNSQFSTLNSQ
jgi:hypothetical protein